MVNKNKILPQHKAYIPFYRTS